MRLYCVVREYFEKYENCGFCLLRILFFRAAYDLPDKYKLIYKNRKNFSKGFVVIDYKSNVIKIKDYFDKNNDNNVECVFLSQIIPENMLNNVYAEEVKVYGCIYRA